jgi:predicted Zn-dependent protease
VTLASPTGTRDCRRVDRACAPRSTLLDRPPKILVPGEYRAWLSPAALAELVGMMNWGGFSASALMSGQSPLARLKSDADRFSERVHLSDDLATGGLPRFQSDGFERPGCLGLVDAGRFAAALVSPRSAREFALQGTGATSHEVAQALSLAGGELADGDAMAALGTGVAVSNFWYLNWSDRAAGRLTGMTRFASLWVENGEPVAPLSVMRFDDSLFRLLGSQLEALGRQVHRIRYPDL